jgi:hypothetical protein
MTQPQKPQTSSEAGAFGVKTKTHEVEMNVTAIIKDVSDQFFTGVGDFCGFDNMTDKEKLKFVMNNDITSITAKVGSGQFRDRVELNQIMRKDFKVNYSLSPRRGYKLATFNVTA